MLKILLVHNFYNQPGGEDRVFLIEQNLLGCEGHKVASFTIHNNSVSSLRKSHLLVSTFWNLKTQKALKKLIDEEKPSLIHFHNIFPLISPSSYESAYEAEVPIVQTLHNYRLLCPDALLLRAGKVCEDCLGKFIPWPGMWHACYRSSFGASAVTTTMLTFHRALGTYRRRVDTYIALTEFARRKFIQGGLPAEKIVVKPNFVSADPGPRNGLGEYALFVGRLSTEKGIMTLLKAWRKLPDVPLKIAGDGPLMNDTRALVEQNNLQKVEFLGRCEHDDVLRLMKSARFLIFPSEWYETFGMVAIEAYACGLPVIASRLGAMEELILDGETGLHFTPGSADDLAEKVSQLWADDTCCAEMGRRARAEYESKYTAEENYRQLMAIYQMAIENHRKG